MPSNKSLKLTLVSFAFLPTGRRPLWANEGRLYSLCTSYSYQSIIGDIQCNTVNNVVQVYCWVLHTLVFSQNVQSECDLRREDACVQCLTWWWSCKELSVVLMRSSLPVISSNVIHIYINLLEDVVLPFLFFLVSQHYWYSITYQWDVNATDFGGNFCKSLEFDILYCVMELSSESNVLWINDNLVWFNRMFKILLHFL